MKKYVLLHKKRTEMVQIRDIAVDFGGNDFLLPYFRRELGVTGDDAPLDSVAAVKIVTDITEPSADTSFDDFCRDRRLPVTVLQSPCIVGTGMRGLPRRIAAGIYKGSYVHIACNEARVSVVHATDVARAAAMAAGTSGTFNLTDLTDPTVHDLAEALSWRLGQKRIFTIAPRWARLWLGSHFYTQLTTSRTIPETFSHLFTDFTPVSVTEYLKNHIYDEQSL